MPVEPHPSCMHPSDDTEICRFMDMAKFRDLFANDELYLRRVDKFKETDPNEALASDEYVRRALGLVKYDIKDELKLNNDQAFNRQHSEAFYLNCWQLFEGETLNMWNTYGNGVAVFSRFGLLKEQLDKWLDIVFVGTIQYGEKDMTGYNLIEFLFRKRTHFAKEKELRILLRKYNLVAGMNRHFDENGFPHREPLPQYPVPPWVHDFKRRPVDLNSLVTAIRTGPALDQESIDEIKQWVDLKKLTCGITRSELSSGLCRTAEEMKKYGF